MKRKYTAPEAEIERFTLADVITNSTTGGIYDGGEGTTVDDDF